MPAATALAVFAMNTLGLALSPDLTTAVILTAVLRMMAACSSFARELHHAGLASLAQIGAPALSFVALDPLPIPT